MFKRITILSLCLCLLCLGSTKVFANEFIEGGLSEEYLESSPYMNYISKSSCLLYINSNGIASTECSINGYQGITTKVSITANLQRYKDGRWLTIKTFTTSSNSHRILLRETANISKGYSYRVSS